MNKLLNAYRNHPTLPRAERLRSYDRLHPMARCVLDKADADLLADAIHHANTGKTTLGVPEETRSKVEDALRAKFPGLGDRLIVI